MGSPSRYSSKQHGSSWLNWPNMITLKGPHLSNHGSLERYEKVPKNCFFFVETWGCGGLIFLVSFHWFGWFVGKHGEEFVSWKLGSRKLLWKSRRAVEFEQCFRTLVTFRCTAWSMEIPRVACYIAL